MGPGEGPASWFQGNRITIKATAASTGEGSGSNRPFRIAPERVVGHYADVRLMSKLRLRVAFFINGAIPAFRNNAVAISGPQDAGRHHPGLDEILRIFDRHVVADFIANTRESFDDVHVGGMQ